MSNITAEQALRNLLESAEEAHRQGALGAQHVESVREAASAAGVTSAAAAAPAANARALSITATLSIPAHASFPSEGQLATAAATALQQAARPISGTVTDVSVTLN